MPGCQIGKMTFEPQGWGEGGGGWVTEHGCTYVVVHPSTTVTKILFFKSRIVAQIDNGLQDLSGQSTTQLLLGSVTFGSHS